jgi:metallo-beta-lactamase class B
MDAMVGSQARTVVIIGGIAVNPGFRLVHNARYPQIAADYERTFKVLKSLSADIPLGAHGSYFDLEVKYQELMRGDETAFVDPEGYTAYVAAAERAFAEELVRQKSH